jgi:hypothetical protein
MQLYSVADDETVLTFAGDPHAPDVQAAVTSLVASSGGKLASPSAISLPIVGGVALALAGLGFLIGRMVK